MKNMRLMLKSIWLSPAVQVIVYITMLLGLLYLCWHIITGLGLVPMASTNVPTLMLVQEILQSSISVMCLLVFIKFVQHRSLSSTGIVRKGILIETLTGFGLGFIIAGGTILAMALTGVYHVHGINPNVNFIYPIILFFFGAITEEVIFRIFVFQTCEKRWGTIKAMIISSTLFGLVHMINNVPIETSQKLCGCFFLIFEAGFSLTAVFLIKRRIWLPLGLHWAWNFFEGPVFGGVVSGNNFGAPLINATISGPFLLTGGGFGPEASLPGLLVGTACGALALRYAIEKGSWKPAETTEITQ